MTTDPVASSSTPTASTKRYRPYFTPAEVERLSAKQRGKLSVSREERNRQQACGFIDAVGGRAGFPRRTIATAQTLYMRFHLFFPMKDFNYMEVALSTLYVSSKLHDTLKKPRDLILISYALRFPNLVKKGSVDVAAVDPNMLEAERKRVLNIERLVLETMCFRFEAVMAFGVVIKLARALHLSKERTMQAWKVAFDCYRTPAALSFPPHVLAIAALYISAIFESESARLNTNNHDDLTGKFSSKGQWETEYAATADEVDDVTHAIIDLYSIILSIPSSDPATQFAPSPASPRENPSSQSSKSGSPQSTAYHLSAYWTVEKLTELKIHLRERRPDQVAAVIGWPESPVDEGTSSQVDEAVEGMGRNDATVRFIWDDEDAAAA